MLEYESLWIIEFHFFGIITSKSKYGFYFFQMFVLLNSNSELKSVLRFLVIISKTIFYNNIKKDIFQERNVYFYIYG